MTRKITAVIKAKNEGQQIVDCIKSVEGFADEVIVVDDNSTDRTVELAELAGARVIHFECRDGMINRLDKIGFEAAQGEWILRIDADERMTKTLAVALNNVIETGNYNGVKFSRKNISFGKWASYGGWFKNDQLRFFKADSWDRKWHCEPHSHPDVNGNILVLPRKPEYATDHINFITVEQAFRRNLCGYAKTEAEVMYKKGMKPSLLRLFFKPAKRIFGRLIIRQGIRDGWMGLILSGMLGIKDFCVEAILWDMHCRGKHTNLGEKDTVSNL